VNGTDYHPSHPKFVRSLLGSLKIDYSQYTFVDLGSGKGRVLLIACEYPFRRIIGVEFAKQLHDIAQRNIASYRGSRECADITSVWLDVAEFTIPIEPIIFFMFNPFRPPVMREVIGNIVGSLQKYPRPCLLIYDTPYHSALIREPFTLVRESENFKVFASLSQLEPNHV